MELRPLYNSLNQRSGKLWPTTYFSITHELRNISTFLNDCKILSEPRHIHSTKYKSSIECCHGTEYSCYKDYVHVQLLSRVWLSATPWTVAHQTPMSMGFSRQEYWSGLPFPTPGDLPNPGIKPTSPPLAGGFFLTVPPGKPLVHVSCRF